MALWGAAQEIPPVVEGKNPRMHRFTHKGVGIGLDLRVGRKPALSRTRLSLPLSTRTSEDFLEVCPLSPFLGNNPVGRALRPLLEFAYNGTQLAPVARGLS